MPQLNKPRALRYLYKSFNDYSVLIFDPRDVPNFSDISPMVEGWVASFKNKMRRKHGEKSGRIEVRYEDKGDHYVYTALFIPFEN